MDILKVQSPDTVFRDFFQEKLILMLQTLPSPTKINFSETVFRKELTVRGGGICDTTWPVRLESSSGTHSDLSTGAPMALGERGL